MNLAAYHREIRARLDDEIGTIRKDAPDKVALLYPSPYHVAMSSLGFQSMYREINAIAGRVRSAKRAKREGPSAPGKTEAVPEPVAAVV